jgi:hypothetical protein
MRIARAYLRLLALAPRQRGEPWAGVRRGFDLCIAVQTFRIAGNLAVLVMLFRINEALP